MKTTKSHDRQLGGRSGPTPKTRTPHEKIFQRALDRIGMSRRKAADLLGINEGTLSKSMGRGRPQKATLERLRVFLNEHAGENVSLEELRGHPPQAPQNEGGSVQ